MISVIFMGTPEFAVPALQALIDAPDVTVQAVFCSPDKPVGRKQQMQAPATKMCALAHHIPVHQPASLRDNKEVEALLRSYAPDFFVVAAYGFIIPKALLAIPKILPINIHGSLLPKYRGASPIQSALLHGEPETGITFIEMVAAMDAGDMLGHVSFPLGQEDTSDSVFARMAALGGVHIVPLLRQVATGTYTRIPQNPDEVTFCSKITKEMGAVYVLQETATDIYHKWQAFTSWPGIYLLWEEKRIKVLRCAVSDVSLVPGEVLLQEGVLLIGCREGSLALHQVQREGKTTVDGATFFRGYPEFGYTLS